MATKKKKSRFYIGEQPVTKKEFDWYQCGVSHGKKIEKSSRSAGPLGSSGNIVPLQNSKPEYQEKATLTERYHYGWMILTYFLGILTAWCVR